MSFWPDIETEHAKTMSAQVREALIEGKFCPTCGQYCKLYRRGLGATQARILTRLRDYQIAFPDESFVYVPALIMAEREPLRRVTRPKNGMSISGSDFAKMIFWGLVEAGELRGYYKMTERGCQFLQNEIVVPKHVFIYNNTLFGYSRETISVKDAWGTLFNLDATMMSRDRDDDGEDYDDE